MTGKLVSIGYNAPEWDDAFLRFEQLYWAELSMVEAEVVKKAMQDFAEQLRSIKADKTNGREVAKASVEELKQRSYRLARALRAGIEQSWSINLNNGMPPP